MANPEGDPVWPGRSGAVRTMVIDEGQYIAGKGPHFPGGAHYADDYMTLLPAGLARSTTPSATSGTTARSGTATTPRPRSAAWPRPACCAIAEKGVVGRGILLDMARFRGKDVPRRRRDVHPRGPHGLRRGPGHARSSTRDILIIRTGWIAKFYKVAREEFYGDFVEPGLTYSPELVQWFHDMEIPNLVTDTIANEVTVDPVSGVVLPLHNALMRNLGVTLTEIAWLDDLADDCAADGQYTFLYTAAPLKVVDGTGAPVNPVVIK